MAELLIASGNFGKVDEFAALLAPLGLGLHTLRDVHGLKMPEETGQSFLENATLKALTLCAQSGLPTLADDSGLEVEALNGFPGIFSARFAGPDDRARRQAILARLEEVGNHSRRASFCAALVLALPSGEVHQSEARLPGLIATSECGQGGFGYDPIFYVPELGRCLAEMTPEEKNHCSHRALALRGLWPQLLHLAKEG